MNTNMLTSASNGVSSQRLGLLDEWYVYQDGGAHIGPVSLDLLARGIASGKVPRTAFAGPAGCGEWHGVLEYPQVVAALAAIEAPKKSPDATIQMAPPSLNAFATPPAPPRPPVAAPLTAAATPPVTAAPSAAPPATAIAAAPAPATAAPTATAAAPAPATAAPAAVAKPAAKPEEKKDPLDPRYRFLPLAIFGGFGFLAMIEVVIGLVVR